MVRGASTPVAGVAVGTLVLALLPVFDVPRYLLTVLTEVYLFAVFAMSLDLLIGYVGLASLGHAAFWGLGAYAAGIAAIRLNPSALVSIPVGVLVAGLGALLVGALSVRVSGVYFLMLTLAFAQIVYAIAFKWTWLTGGSNGLAGIPPPTIPVLNLSDPRAVYYVTLLAVVGTLWGLWRLVRSPFGHTLIGIRENEPRMRSLGYNTFPYKLAAFVLAGVVAGFAGALYAVAYARSVSPADVYWTQSGLVMIMVIIGGVGTLIGPVLGAAFELLLRNWVSSLPGLGERWMLIMGLVFAAFVLFARGGLVGIARRAVGVSLSAGPRAVVLRSDSADPRHPGSQSGAGAAVEPVGAASDAAAPWSAAPRDAATSNTAPAGGVAPAPASHAAEGGPGPLRAAAPIPAAPQSEPRVLLDVQRLSRRFGAVRALNAVSFAVAEGERRAVIGPNGAGKTTLFNLIAGDLAASDGSILFEGRDLSGVPTHARTRLGIGRTYQRSNLFLGLSALENVELAVRRRLGVAARPFRPAAEYQVVHAESLDFLTWIGLAERAAAPVRALSYGEQRQLEIAVALGGSPRLLLLDEPTAGMSPAETAIMLGFLRDLPRNVSLLIIEHDMDVVFALADRITVLHHGEVLADGPPDVVRANPDVQAAYLGTSALPRAASRPS